MRSQPVALFIFNACFKVGLFSIIYAYARTSGYAPRLQFAMGLMNEA
jgi:hypothetical protein